MSALKKNQFVIYSLQKSSSTMSLHNFEEFCNLNEGEMIQEGFFGDIAKKAGIVVTPDLQSLLSGTQTAISEIYKKTNAKFPDPKDKANRSKMIQDLAKANSALGKSGDAYISTLEKLLIEAKKDKFSFMKPSSRNSLNNLYLLGASAKQAKDGAKPATPSAGPGPRRGIRPSRGR